MLAWRPHRPPIKQTDSSGSSTRLVALTLSTPPAAVCTYSSSTPHHYTVHACRSCWIRPADTRSRGERPRPVHRPHFIALPQLISFQSLTATATAAATYDAAASHPTSVAEPACARQLLAALSIVCASFVLCECKVELSM